MATPLTKYEGSGLTTLLSQAIGINNKIVPHRLPFTEAGVSALESAKDVLIDATGEIITRRGSKLLVSGVYHSGYTIDDTSFYCIQDRSTDSALLKVVLNADNSIDEIGIRSSLTKGAKCYFTKLGSDIYYANGYERGVLDDSALSSNWPDNSWTGPETTSQMIYMPVGICLDILAGRMLVAVGPELFFSEYGLLNLTDELKNRVRFESSITMVCSVQTGVYVSDETSLYFLEGLNPNTWTLLKVLDYPAYGKNQDLVDPSFHGLKSTRLSGLFATAQGQVIGLPDGSVYNLINKNVALPANCGNGAILVVDETTILQS